MRKKCSVIIVSICKALIGQDIIFFSLIYLFNMYLLLNAYQASETTLRTGDTAVHKTFSLSFYENFVLMEETAKIK